MMRGNYLGNSFFCKEMAKCSYCGKVSDKALNKCSRCRVAEYCNATCQKAHWKDHKTECKKPETTAGVDVNKIIDHIRKQDDASITKAAKAFEKYLS